MEKYALQIITIVLVGLGLMGVSITGAASYDQSEYCSESMMRACYELDVGPFSFDQLPPEARVQDTFMLNPKAGPNKWRACERTNTETVMINEFETSYCGENAVETVKSCYMGNSEVKIYYYTGECTPTGYPICNEWITLPSECVWSGDSARTLIESVNEDIYELSQDLELIHEHGYCTYGREYNYWGKVEVRRLQEDPVVNVNTWYKWVYDLNQPCIEGELSEVDVSIQQIRGGIINIRASVSNEDGITGGNERYKYTLNIYGCSDFDDIYRLWLNDGEIIRCNSVDPYFCTC